MTTQRERYEQILGDPAALLPNRTNIPTLRLWAIEAGFNPIDVNIATGATLVNWYHEKVGKIKESPLPKPAEMTDRYQLAADMFVKILEATKVPGFNVELTRAVAEDQFRRVYSDLAAELQEEMQRKIDAIPPRRIEIVTPSQPTIVLDGLMHYKTESIIRVASLNHAIMLVGPAGCGKTTIGEHTARALNLPFYITSTINEPHELTGFIDGNGNYHATPFRHAFEHGGLWIADEIDAWDASALLTANAALANGICVFPDNPQPVRRNVQFRMIATANTFGNGADAVYIGRNELDAASLDRFAMIRVDYDLNLEQAFSRGNTRWLNHVWNVRKAISEKKIRHVASSRAIAFGAAALEIGLTWADVQEFYLLKGMSEGDRKKIAKSVDIDAEIPF